MDDLAAVAVLMRIGKGRLPDGHSRRGRYCSTGHQSTLYDALLVVGGTDDSMGTLSIIVLIITVYAT